MFEDILCAGCVSAALSPVLDATLIVFHPIKNGSYDQGEEDIDSKLHGEKTVKAI